ncbi:uncharacterized protein [Physcomitrium patens]|uniref:uncharacterized protein isoform X1 n=1 Tax=Physcomitrium patens TaxID=3218 RepID=UPI003CCD2823
MKKHRHDENIMGLNTEHHSDVTLPNSLALVQNVTTSSRSLALLFIWSIWGWFVRSNTHPHPRMTLFLVSNEIMSKGIVPGKHISLLNANKHRTCASIRRRNMKMQIILDHRRYGS